MDSMKQDVHFALRQIRRTPLLSGFIVATLAIGIGITAAMFSAVDTLLLRPIYRDEQQLIQNQQQAADELAALLEADRR